jgi:hypothetical protein
MIYSLADGIGYIHVPRTGGFSIRAALKEVLHQWVAFDLEHMHATAYWIREYLMGPEAFDRITWFAGTRHPVDLLWSSYCSIVEAYEANPTPIGTSAAWIEETRLTVELGFERNVRERWFNTPRLAFGGFWRTYCCDLAGKQYPNVLPIRYGEFARDVRAMFRLLGASASVPHLNPSRGRAWKGRVSEGIVGEIMEFCGRDGYE